MNALPSNLYAEKLVIGSLLLRGDRWPEFADSLTPADFSLDAHRVIWKRLADMASRGLPIAMDTLAGDLMRSGDLDKAGGFASITYLTEHVPELPNLASYIALVREASTRRRIIHAAELLQRRAADADQDLPSISEHLRGLATEFGDDGGSEVFSSIPEIIERNGGLDAYITRRQGASLPYPWVKLQETTGGLRAGHLVVIAAETGGGKTAFAGNIAQHVATHGHGVALFSLEMGREEVCDRQLALAGRFNSRVFKHSLHTHQLDRVMEASGVLFDSRLWISDVSGLTVSKIIGSVERLRAHRRVDLVIVDYLQLMQGKGQGIVEQVSNIARGLKEAAVQLKLPVIALSQFAKAKVGDQRQGADLKYGSEISQAANLILILTGEQRYLNSPAEWLEWTLLVDKQRDGEAPLKIDMLWRKDCGLFMEASDGLTA